MLPQLLRERRPDRERPLPGLRLRRVGPTAHDRLAKAQERPARVDQVHVAPAKPEDLAPPEPGADDGEEDRSRLLAPAPLLPLRLLDQLTEGALDAADLDRAEDRPLAPGLTRALDRRD